MTPQLSLDSAIARRTDPETSHIAAARLTESGKRVTQAQLVLTYVRRHPGLTAAEYGALTGLGHVPTQRRLSDLMRAGSILQGDRRKCSQNHTEQVTWWPARAE